MSNNPEIEIMWEYRTGHVIEVLRAMPSESVHCVPTSPPYWGLRKYDGDQDVLWPDGTRGSYGLEKTPDEYVQRTIQILREIKRVLRKDGVVFWNIGDCYAGSGKGVGSDHGKAVYTDNNVVKTDWTECGLKAKDLALIPFRVALAAQADGWWVRSDIIWAKPNPMPENVRDRPTKAHEYIFMFTKSPTYFWDQEALREKLSAPLHRPGNRAEAGGGHLRRDFGTEAMGREWGNPAGRNIRSVWTINTQSGGGKGVHYAAFPEELVRRCILAATSERGYCPKCGEPWVRVLQRTKAQRTDRTDNPNASGLMRCPSSKNLDVVKTVGWQPSCTCYEIDGYGYWDAVEVGRWVGPDGDSEDSVGHWENDIDFLWKPIRPLNEHPVNPAIVLDPFVGTGTTLKVARLLGRDAIGIDISKKYEEIGVAKAMLNTPDILSFEGKP